MWGALITDLKRSPKLFMNETRAPVLDPKAGKTKTGYFWALARDDRPWVEWPRPAWPSPMRRGAAAKMPMISCRASRAAYRSTAMPGITV